MVEQAAFTVRDADYAADFHLLRAVRDAVFINEQQVPLDLERDALDPDCRHVLALDALGRPLGTGRLTPQRTIGRMAVIAEWRGKGVGEALLRRLITVAAGQAWPDVSLHAQLGAIGFYRKYGFESYGPEYMEAGIRHQSMRLALQPQGN